MTHFKELDEYTTHDLQGELDRREAAAATGVCYYCNRSIHTAPCKFPELHSNTVRTPREAPSESEFRKSPTTKP